MKKSVEVVSLKQHCIEYRVRVKRQSIVVPISLAFIVITLVCFSFGGNFMYEIGSNVAYVFNPVNSLYSDNSQIVFTNGDIVDKNKLDFVVPIKSDKIEVVGDYIHFTCVNSIMVMSSEGGVVRDVGVSLDGVKYIVIRHSEDLESVIENVDIVGVTVGEIVKRGQDIATAKIGESIRFKLVEGGNSINNLSVNKSKIVWKD